jgi:hypothetical protein
MRACSSRSIDTALDFLMQQLHTTRQTKEGVATLFVLNMTCVFDRVVLAWLPHNIMVREILEWILK